MVSGGKHRKTTKDRSRPLSIESGGRWHERKDDAGSYTEFGELDGLPRMPPAEQVAPKSICWAASLKHCSSLRVLASWYSWKGTGNRAVRKPFSELTQMDNWAAVVLELSRGKLAQSLAFPQPGCLNGRYMWWALGSNRLLSGENRIPPGERVPGCRKWWPLPWSFLRSAGWSGS